MEMPGEACSAERRRPAEATIRKKRTPPIGNPPAMQYILILHRHSCAAGHGCRVVTLKAMQVKVLFFGMLKDIVGRAEEQLDLPGNTSLGGVFAHYAECFPPLREMAGSIVLAKNHEF